MVATGGSTACRRVPSGSRASAYGLAVVEPAAAGGREALGQPPYVVGVADRDGRALQSRTPVDPDL